MSELPCRFGPVWSERVRDRLTGALVRSALGLPPGVVRRLSGPGARVDGQELHPEVRLGLRLLALSPEASFETLSPAQARAEVSREAAMFGGPEISLPSVRDLEIPGDAGPLRARLYRPETVSARPGLLVYFHGGGWVVGGPDTVDSVCRFLAAHAEVAVLSVDYRLAPENPFPAAVDDALAAMRYAATHAAALEIDGDAIAVGGDSAGGNLAAVVCQQAAIGLAPMPVFQLLFFPVSDTSAKARSYELFGEGYFLTEAQMDWYIGHYLPNRPDRLDPRASPLLAEDLTGLPPAYVAVAGFDPLRDEGEATPDDCSRRVYQSRSTATADSRKPSSTPPGWAPPAARPCCRPQAHYARASALRAWSEGSSSDVFTAGQEDLAERRDRRPRPRDRRPDTSAALIDSAS
jgi:acetyl esterase